MSDKKDSAKNPSEPEFDEFLRDDEARLAALYRKLPLAAPDAPLDARVRALAQRALLSSDDAAADAAWRDDAAGLTPTQMYLRHPRWLPALSAAAVLVLAAGIVWRVLPPSGGSGRERAAATAVAASEGKARNGSARIDQTATAARGPALADAPADKIALAPRNITESGPAALSKAQRPAAAEPAPARPAIAATAGRTAAPGTPQAFPSAPAQQQGAVREEREKVENAASPPAYATGAPAVAAAAARGDESRALQAAQQGGAAPGVSPASSRDAARAPAAKSVPTDRSAGIASGVQSSIATCPGSPGGDWRGRYPPEIPPSSRLRRQFVKTLVAQGRLDEARRAYVDFRAHCPADSWPPDLLNHLQMQ